MTSTKKTMIKRYGIAVIEPDPNGEWRLMVTTQTGLGGQSKGQWCYLAQWQIDQLGIEELPCNWPVGDDLADPDAEPCCHPAVGTSNFCSFHGATTAGLAVR